MDLGTLNWSVEVDTSDLSRAEREMDGTREAAEGARRGVDQFGNSTTQAARKTRTASERMQSDMRSTSRATDALKNAVTGLVGALGAREIIRYSDAWNNAANQLRQVTTGTQELTRAQQSLVNVARDTRSNFEATANLYARLARSTTELGLSQQNLIDLTTTINQSFAASGATAEEASNAITQLSQGLASGALRGDEFNSVAEQAPGILRAVAESLNMGIGELREFAATGGITAEIVVSALQQASDTIANDFGKTVATFGQQMEVARTNLTQWIGTSDEVQGALSALGESVVFLSNNLDAMVKAGQVAAALYAGRFVAGMVSATTAMSGAVTVAGVLRGAMMALGGPLGLLIGAGGLLYVFRDELNLTGHRAGLTEDQIADLRDEMADMSQEDLSQSLSSLNTALDAATIKAATAREELAQLRSENRGSGVLGFGAGQVGAEVRGMNAVAEAQERIVELNQKINVAREETAQRIEDNANSFVVYADRLERTREETALADDATKALNDTAETSAGNFGNLSDSLNTLLNRLNPARARTQAYAQGVGLLNTALATGTLNFGDYQRAMVALQEELYNVEEETETATEEMSREWERFGNSVDETFKDAFKGAFDSFESFADRLKGAFENLMAELAYAAVKNEIKIQLGMGTSGPMSGGIGQLFGGQGGGLGGISSLYNGAKKLPYVGDAIGGIGSALGFGASATAPIGYASGFGAAAATGTYTGFAGSAAAGAAAAGGGGLMGAASAAMPWLAGGALIDNVLGLGIVDGIVGAVSDLFGGGETTPRLNISTRGDASQFGHESVSTGAFGAVGFSEGTRRSNDLFGSIENERAWLDSVAAMDNMLASVAQSPEQLGAMTSAVQNVVITSGDAATANDMLVQRTQAAANIIDAEFTAALVNAGATAEEITQRFVTANAAMQTLNAVAERLNLQWDSGAEGALRYADAIANQVGGVQQLAALQESYYQQYFTDAERTANLQADLTSTLGQLGMTLPETRDGFRALVEAQDLSTEAGQRNYAALLQVSGAFSELVPVTQEAAQSVTDFSEAIRVRESLERELLQAQGDTDVLRQRELDSLRELAGAEEQGLVALQQRIWAMEDAERIEREYAQAQRDALRDAQSTANAAMQTLQSAVQREQDRLRTAQQRQMDDYQQQISVASESISQLEQFTTRLRSAIEGVRVESFALDRSRLQSARGAIASAATSGVTTLTPALESALGTVGQDSQQFYGDFESYVRDQVATSQNIGSLYSNAQEQLTIEQRMLYALEDQRDRAEEQFNLRMAGLDSQLEAYQRQIDAIMGVDNSVLSLGAAIASVESAIRSLQLAAPATSSGGGVSGSGGGASSGLTNAQIKEFADRAVGETGGDWDAAGRIIGQAAIDAGVSSQQLAEALGKDPQAVADRISDLGLPGFANGGAHAGGWRVVGERGPELEYTGPSRIMSNSDTRSMMDNSQVKESVDRMNQNLEVVLRGILEASQETASIMDDWDTLGQPGERNVTA